MSLIDQPAKIRGYCRSHELELIDIVEDGGECSKSLHRPKLQRILGMLSSGVVAGIVVTKLNRLTRHVGDMVHLVENYFIDPPLCHLISASETVETRTASGRMLLYIMTAVDQQVRESIVENTVGAMAGKRSRGERTGNLRFGQTVDPSDQRRSKTGQPVALIPCLEDLAVIDLILGLRRHGLSLRGIADELNRRGIASKRGVTKRSTGLWSKSSVAEILKR